VLHSANVEKNALQLESSHVQIVEYRDVEAVGRRKSGFSERLRFLLNAMQRQQSGADDLLNNCREVDWEHGIRGMACKMPRCQFPDGYREVWLVAQRATFVFDSITLSCPCTKRHA
jgi:hypothetical protein